jgi:plasmid stabilization system protein ParE
MNWTVIYRPDAADDLTTIWLDATDRQAIAAAANSIDRQLGIAPFAAGESREGNSRILFEGPLTVFFDVDEQSRIVTVWAVVQRD